MKIDYNSFVQFIKDREGGEELWNKYSKRIKYFYSIACVADMMRIISYIGSFILFSWWGILFCILFYIYLYFAAYHIATNNKLFFASTFAYLFICAVIYVNYKQVFFVFALISCLAIWLKGLSFILINNLLKNK